MKLVTSRLAWELVPQRLVKSLSKFWPSREVSMATPCAQTTPACSYQLAPSECQIAPSWSSLQLKMKCWQSEFHIATANNDVQRKWLKFNFETFAYQQAGYFSFCWYICELIINFHLQSKWMNGLAAMLFSFQRNRGSFWWPKFAISWRKTCLGCKFVPFKNKKVYFRPWPLHWKKFSGAYSPDPYLHNP